MAQQTDKFGNPLQIDKSGLNIQRVHGFDCLRTSIRTIREIASFLSSSFGPNGMDKILVSQDAEITMSNDGATILKQMGLTENPIAQMVVNLSESQDDEIGDGTTGVVLLASALLDQCEALVEKGIHPIKLIEGLYVGLEEILNFIGTVGEPIKPASLSKALHHAAASSLCSKITAKNLKYLSGVCVEAARGVVDIERKDLDFELISLKTKMGADIGDTQLIRGVVIDKEFSHPQMPKNIENAKIAILTCPFEPPKLKTNNELEVTSAEDYKNLLKYEKETFLTMIKCIKDSGCQLVVCQWGFDDEANSLLLQNGLMAIRWVGGEDIEQLAVYLGCNIVARFEDLRSQDLGCATVQEESIGIGDDRMITFSGVKGEKEKTLTIMIRGNNKIVVEEAKRAIYDGLCAVRNILINPKIVYGGGSFEVALFNYLQKNYNKHSSEILICIEAINNALLQIPIILANNCAFDGIKVTSDLIKHNAQNNEWVGVDCYEKGEQDMKKNNVFDSSVSKEHQFTMAFQLASMILKIDDVITFDK